MARPYKPTNFTLNPDGTITRSPFALATTPATPEPSSAGAADPSLTAFSKDVPLNPNLHTWIRIFRPASPPPESTKLPIIVHFHGSGFVLLSAASSIYKPFLDVTSSGVPAIVLTVEYRLAPEHRLPAAYDDAVDAVMWIRDQALRRRGNFSGVGEADPWLEGADFGRCYLMGESAGGNIAYHAWRRVATEDLLPVRIAGLVLNVPYFGGEARTESEIAMEEDEVLPLELNDLMWKLALPEGANRDHEYCNIVTAAAAGGLRPPARCLVRGNVGDPLIDRQREVARVMEEAGWEVVANLDGKGGHSALDLDPMVAQVKEFVGIHGGGGHRAVDG